MHMHKKQQLYIQAYIYYYMTLKHDNYFQICFLRIPILEKQLYNQ